jgi:hypothetical protein
MLTLATFGFSQLIEQLNQIGFFKYVLPFLLIFAFSYALLSMLPIFDKNKGAAAIVAFALGFLSLQLDFVPLFFQTIFPKFGIGLGILLVGLILSGVFIGDQWKTPYTWIFFGLGAIIFLVIVFSSLSDYTSGLEGFWERYGALLIVGLLLIGAIVAIFVASGSSGEKKKKE